MKRLALALSLVFGTAASAQEHKTLEEHQVWRVQVGQEVYDVEILELLNKEHVRIKYHDGLIGLANKSRVKWLEKLAS